MSILAVQTYASQSVPIFRASLNDGPQQAVSIETMQVLKPILNNLTSYYPLGVFSFPENVSNITARGLLKYTSNYATSITANIYLTTNADGSPSGAFGSTLTGVTLTASGSYVNLFGLTLSNIDSQNVYLGMAVTAGLPAVGFNGTVYLTSSSWSVPASGQWTVGYAPYTSGAVAGGAILGIGT